MAHSKNVSFKQKIGLVIFGLFLVAILAEVGLRMGGFLLVSLQEYRNRISIRQKGTHRIMCLGESTTADFGYGNSYPFQLEKILNQQDIGIRFKVINKGVPRINTGFILAHLEENLNKYNPDMVITMMGINDENDDSTYEDVLDRRTTLFFESFKVYKLLKLFRLHIINKVGEIRARGSRKYVAQVNDPNPLPINNNKQKLPKEPIENFQTYFESGIGYRRMGEFDKAEEMFKRAIEMDPRNYRTYIELGWHYCRQEKMDKAEEVFKKSIEINPGNNLAYVELGQLYFDVKKLDKAEETFKKSIEVNPGNNSAYVELGQLYCYKKKFDMAEKILNKAEEVFKKSIEAGDADNHAYIKLGLLYCDLGKWNKAEEIFKKAIEIEPKSGSIYGALGNCYQASGRHKLAEESFKEANRLRLGLYNTITRHNYQRLKEILNQRGVKLVCVQYPMRKIETLKRMLEPCEGIIFVDNENVFKQAIKHKNYDEYFTDRWVGDFGHCTPEGNKLLAENITTVILRECFDE